MERPTYIDISAANSRAPSSAGTSRTGQPSPRIQHFDGDVPPILSPLDAFAAESRRLAKELEATRLAGERRMSRLPPQVITKSLTQHHANRPACFRSLPSNSESQESLPAVPALPTLPRQDSFGGDRPELNEPTQRPKSSYPRISAVVQDEEDERDVFKTPRERPAPQPSQDYFGSQRTQSPQHFEYPARPANVARTSSNNSQTKSMAGLAPPSAPFLKNRYQESSDDDYTSSNAGSTFSQPRKMSNSSGTSVPVSPAVQSHERSPSLKSDTSSSSQSKSKQRYNFSRPMSPVSGHLRPDSPNRTLKIVERKPSHQSEKTRGITSFEDSRSVMSDGFVPDAGSSYTHDKSIIPKGKLSEKAAQKVSQLFSGLSTPDFRWQEPRFSGAPPLTGRTDDNMFHENLSSPSFRPSLGPGSPSVNSHTGFMFGFEQSAKGKMNEPERPSSSRTAPESDRPSDRLLQRHLTAFNASSLDRNEIPTLLPIPGSTADDMSLRSSRPNTATQRSASTVRPTTARSHSDYQALSADDHVDKAIELHQIGDLKESTYHLRIAAKNDHPTGMLLYALACRHGWGMRPNPAEAVNLLRHAVDIAMAEIAEDESPDISSPKPKADFLERKSHRAQFALGLYELGNSHYHGWGVEQDRALALRCFEIAGSWGDGDALAQAGMCYVEGIGCKKNLKKAAKLYRQAAVKGVSMVGESWIYKDKYNDDNNDDMKKGRGRKSEEGQFREKEKDKKKEPRNKSKTRSIFGRKRAPTMSERGRAQLAVDAGL